MKDFIEIAGIKSEDLRTELGIYSPKENINGSNISVEWMNPAFLNKP
jgi:hypothetical protein